MWLHSYIENYSILKMVRLERKEEVELTHIKLMLA